MLLLVTGGTGSGKSAYAGALAESLAREAILFSCPAWPPLVGEPDEGRTAPPERERGRRGFQWSCLPADADCAQALNRVNLDSNPYRAERRALVLDSLSGWLRHRVLEASPAGGAEGAEPEASVSALLDALLGFQGFVIVVSEEAAAGWAGDVREREYIRLLAGANRRLAEAAHTIYRLSFGFAAAIRGDRL